MKQSINWMLQTDLAFDARQRKYVALSSALWTVLGAVIAFHPGISSINGDARAFFIGSILLAALAGVGGTLAAFRGMRRLAILFLFVSVLYPTYFAWALSLIPLALAGYLLFLPRKGRKLAGKTIFFSFLGAMLLVVVAGLAVSLKVGPAKTSVRTATATSLIQTVLTIHVTPSSNLRDGEQVLVEVGAAKRGGKFFLSECASAADANINGCGDQLAAQPFIDTDPSRASSIKFYVKTRAATKPYNTTAFQPCTDQCVIMATGGFGGTFVYAPLKFSK